MSLPKINIQYGRLIDPFFIKALSVSHPKWQPPSLEDVQNKVHLFKNIWKEKGEALLNKVISLTGLNFSREIIDVYIVSGTNRDMSNPMIIRSRTTGDKFPEALTHELIHYLFGHNRENIYPNKFIVKEFPGENDTVISHILVSSIMQEMGFTTVPTDPPYLRAWEIAKEYPIKEFREYLLKKYSRVGDKS
jgi:hypothetical protein